MSKFENIDSTTLTPHQLKIYNIIKVAADNNFVIDYDIKTSKIYYTKNFYILFARLLDAGKTPLEVYNFLGFDTKMLGEDRAYAVAKRAKKLASKPNFGLKIGDYDGSIPREEMGDLSYEEENAYVRARNLYLEKVNELKKKILLQLAEKELRSKR